MYSIYIWGSRVRQHLRSLVPIMNEYWWLWCQMIFRNLVGLKLPDVCLTHEEKPHPGNLSWPQIQPRPTAWWARMLPPVPQLWTWGFVSNKALLTCISQTRHLNSMWYTSTRGAFYCLQFFVICLPSLLLNDWGLIQKRWWQYLSLLFYYWL